MTSFFPIFVKNKYHSQISDIEVSFCFSAFEIACVVSTKLNSVTISKMGRKNSILLGMFLLIISNFFIGTLYYLSEDYPKSFCTLMIVSRCI